MRGVFTSVVLLLHIAGCGGDDEPAVVVTTTPDLTLGEETADTAEGPVGLAIDPDQFFVAAEFAVGDDGRTMSATSVDSFGQAVDLPVRLVILLLDTTIVSPLGVGRENACHVTLETTGNLAQASWAAEAGAWMAFEMPADAHVADDNPRIMDISGYDVDGCNNAYMDAGWGADPAGHVASLGWGIGINEMNADSRQFLQTYTDAQYWAALEPAAVGGGAWVPAFAGGAIGASAYFDEVIGWSTGSRLDANDRLELDFTGNPVLLPLEEISLAVPDTGTVLTDTGVEVDPKAGKGVSRALYNVGGGLFDGARALQP